MKNISSKLLVSLIGGVILVFSVFTTAIPSANALDLWGGKKTDIQTNTGLGATDPREVIAKVINVILGFLGIVAVVMIVLAGFKWMTAGGNQTGVDEARKLLMSAVIGLVIILGAYGIAQFVIKELVDATTKST